MSVVYLGTCEGNAARSLADEIDAGEVTHAALVYRRADGATCYRLIGSNDLTYLIGMLTRAMTHMHCDDQYVIPSQVGGGSEQSPRRVTNVAPSEPPTAAASALCECGCSFDRHVGKNGSGGCATCYHEAPTGERCSEYRRAKPAIVETVSQRCRREHYQACHVCDDLACGDNTSAEAGLVRQARCDERRALLARVRERVSALREWEVMSDAVMRSDVLAILDEAAPPAPSTPDHDDPADGSFGGPR